MTTKSQLLKRTPTIATSSELELILCCARTYLEPTTSDRIKQLIQQELDWHLVLQIALNHGVMPLLYHSLNNVCPESIPTSILSQLKQSFNANTRHNLFLIGELVKTLKLLSAHSIPAISFKGPVLATSIYGDASLRQISDLDILVRSQDFVKVIDLLIAQDYEAKIKVPWECHLVKKKSNIDLHREIIPKHLSCSLNISYPWEHLRSLSLVGTAISTLSPEANLLIFSLNGTKDCWRSLSRICDIAELIRAYPHLNWQKVMGDAESMGFKRVIFLSLFLAKDLLNAKIPDFVWQQIQSDPIVAELVSEVYDNLFSESIELAATVETAFFHIKTRERWQDKFQSLLGLIKHSGWFHPTDRDRDVISLPALFYFLYYLIRPIRVFLRYKAILSATMKWIK